jgi:TPR repeat protein
MGIGFAPGAASTELQGLAMRAQAGDKQAQLDLGIAYEEGRGVSVDLLKARNLYRLASADTGGTTWVYVLGTRKSESGRVTPVDLGVRQSGLREAKVRLSSLRSLNK